MKSLRNLALAVSAVLTATAWLPSCNEASTIGNEIVGDSIQIIVDTSYTMTGRSVADSVVLSRTVTQMLGEIDVPGYGRISSRVVTQFMPAYVLDTAGVSVNDIDSLRLVFRTATDAFVGDALAPVGLTVYRLTRQLHTPIYSDFDPKGYYDPSAPIASTIYSTTAEGQPDSLLREGVREVAVNLPRELAQELYATYRNNPSIYGSPEKFAQVFPGLFLETSFGSGRITRMTRTTMEMYYHRTKYIDSLARDTTYKYVGNYYAVTPEIISNNAIDLSIDQSIYDRVKKGENIILTPAGLELQIELPIPQIIANYRKNTSGSSALGVINNFGITIPAEEIENDYGITPPPCLLLILTRDKEKFFLENQLNDDKTSFYAEYDSSAGTYSYGNLRQYLINLLNSDEPLTPEDYTFSLVPVNLTKETVADYYGTGTTYVTSITPYVTEPKMAKFNLDKAKIKLTYSRQTINF